MRNEFLEKLLNGSSHYCRSSSTWSQLFPPWQNCTECTKPSVLKMWGVHLTGKCLARSSTKWTCLCSGLARISAIPASVMRSATFLTRLAVHIEKKEQGRKEKAADKAHAPECQSEGYEGSKALVACMDLQQILLCFCRHACKRQLCTTNKSYALTILQRPSGKWCAMFGMRLGVASPPTSSPQAMCGWSPRIQPRVWCIHTDAAFIKTVKSLLQMPSPSLSRRRRDCTGKGLERGHTQMEMTVCTRRLRVALPRVKEKANQHPRPSKLRHSHSASPRTPPELFRKSYTRFTVLASTDSTSTKLQ